ncbi:MAG TPA: spore coat protein [Firmicutes bacterium]|nr:spore coat protein [Bacillota bacterium]
MAHTQWQGGQQGGQQQGKLSDKDILQDLLATHKFMSDGYHHAVLESANEEIRKTLTDMHDEAIRSAKDVFDAMNQRGWYQVKPATTS